MNKNISIYWTISIRNISSDLRTDLECLDDVPHSRREENPVHNMDQTISSPGGDVALQHVGPVYCYDLASNNKQFVIVCSLKL